MRDWLFGNIALATKDVQVYSADSIDTAAFHSKYPYAYHTWGVGGHELSAVFSAAAAFAAADSFIPIIQDAADASTFVDIYRGPQTALAIGAGVAAVLNMPRQTRRYLRASALPKSTGTFTAKTVAAWTEHGRAQP